LPCLPHIRSGAHQYIEASPPKIYWFVITHAFDCLVLQKKCKKDGSLAPRLGIAAQSKKNAARQAPFLQLFTVKADDGYCLTD
jgi:hypothetical protein